MSGFHVFNESVLMARRSAAINSGWARHMLPALEARGPMAVHRRSLRLFVASCSGGVLVNRAPELRFYAAAATVAAERRRNVDLVETRPERETEWLAFLREANSAMRLMIGTVRPVGGIH